MIKKILFWTLILFFVIGLFIGYKYLSASKQPDTIAIANLPDSCVFVIESGDFSSLLKKLNETSLLWQELKRNNLEPQGSIDLRFLDSLLGTTEDAESYIIDKSISIIAYNGGNHLNLLLAFNTSAKGLEIWSELLKKTGGEMDKVIANKSGKGVYSYTSKNGIKKIYAYLNKNTIWICGDLNLLDNCLVADKTFQKNNDFNRLREYAGNKNDCRIFLNLNQSGIFLQPELCAYMNTGWMEFDADIKPAEFSLNGILKSDSSRLYRELISQEPQDIEFINYAPEKTISFTFFGFSNYQKFYANYYLKGNNEKTDSFCRKISELAGSELALVETEIKKGKRRKYIQLNIKEIEVAKKLVRDYAIKKTIVVQTDVSDTLYYLKKDNLLNQITAGLMNQPMNHLFFISNYLIFCDGDSSCFEFIDEIQKGKTLAENENFQSIVNGKVSEACNFMNYNYLHSTTSPDFLNSKIAENLSNQSVLFQKLHTFNFQLSASRGNLIAQSYLLYSPIDKVNNESVWEIKLDTTIISSPEFVLNHNTGMTEMIVQDVNKSLYLIGNTGQILWKKELEAEKMSKIFQVDFYKNNKLQYLFNTPNAIHLIDRNGNEVNGFPINLRTPSADAINVFDYEGNGDYRIVYVDTLNKINVLRNDGKPVDGFVFPGTKDRVSKPVEWHRINSKDYLILTDQNGNCYGLGRKGENRLNITESVAGNGNSTAIEKGKGIEKSAIISYDTKNKSLNKIWLNNRMEKKQIKTQLEDPKYFLTKITPDDNFDLILIQGNTLEAYDDRGDVLQRLRFDSELTPTFKKISKGKSIYYSLLTRDGNSIILDAYLKQCTQYNFKSTQHPASEMLNDDGFYFLITINDNLMSAYSF